MSAQPNDSPKTRAQVDEFGATSYGYAVITRSGKVSSVRLLAPPTNIPLHRDFSQPILSNNLAKMGRMHSNGKGISASAIPYSRNPPAWLKTTPDQVVDQICKLAKKGATPSQIGVVLRDSHGIAQVKVVTGKLGLLAMDRYSLMLSLHRRQQNSPHP